MAENQTPKSGDNRALLFGGLAIVVAIVTALVGYIVGTSVERNIADDELNNAEQTISAVQVLSTDSIDALGTSEAAVVGDLEGTVVAGQTQSAGAISTRDAEATNDLATRDADATNDVATRIVEATAAINAVTSTVSVQQTATESTNITQTAVAANATSTPSTPEGVLQPLTVSVRLGPGTEFPIIDTLMQSDVVQIIGFAPDGEWIEIGYVRNERYFIGFVNTDAVAFSGGNLDGVPVAQNFPTLTFTPSPTLTQTPRPTQTPSPVTLTPTPEVPQAEVAVVSAIVYEGPGENFAVVGTLGFDAVVTVEGVTLDGQWLLVENDDISGYVRSDALRFAGGPTSVDVLPTSTPSITPVVPTEVVVQPTAVPDDPIAVASGEFVVVRSGPNEAFDVLGLVSSNEPLDIVGVSRDGQWFRVEFEVSPNGFGWVSGQVVRVSGSLADVPAVDGPPLPTPPNNPDVPNTTDATSSESTGSDASSSAGPTEVAQTATLPETLDIDYTQLGASAYSYEVAVAINGVRDGENYETFLTQGYVEDTITGDLNVSIDAGGALRDGFAGDDLEFLVEFFPLTIGLDGDQSYFYSEVDETCFDLGTEIMPTDIQGTFDSVLDPSQLGILNQLPPNAVFAALDDGGLLGLGGIHYQLLGVEENGQVVPLDDFKIDLWFTEDGSTLYAYRITLNITPETYPFFRDILVEFDQDFSNVSSFDGSVTLYLLPRAVNEVAADNASAPPACDYFIE